MPLIGAITGASLGLIFPLLIPEFVFASTSNTFGRNLYTFFNRK